MTGDKENPDAISEPRSCEADELGGMIRRCIRALVERADEGDALAAEELFALRPFLRDQERSAASAMLRAGYSWAEIGRAAGVSKQAAYERYGGKR